MTTVCCVCQKVKVNGEYVESETSSRVSHGYCPECVKIEYRKLEEYENGRKTEERESSERACKILRYRGREGADQ